jgi:hypothetical protein
VDDKKKPAGQRNQIVGKTCQKEKRLKKETGWQERSNRKRHEN